jgi:NAD(P)-binding Rossmann-like domain
MRRALTTSAGKQTTPAPLRCVGSGRSSRPRVVIAGAGPGGLAEAMLLAHAGADVVVLERKERVGGRPATLHAGAFKFDLGPTFFLYPQVLAEIFAACGHRPEQEVELLRLDPMYHLMFEAGGEIRATPDLAKLAEDIARLSPEDAAAVPRYIGDNRAKFGLPTGSPATVRQLARPTHAGSVARLADSPPLPQRRSRIAGWRRSVTPARRHDVPRHRGPLRSPGAPHDPSGRGLPAQRAGDRDRCGAAGRAVGLCAERLRHRPRAGAPGHSTLYALVPVGNQASGIDWQREAPRYREVVLRRLALLGIPAIYS